VRELSDAEKADLRYGCLFCRCSLFWLGPQGGLSFNIYCANDGCLAGYNVTHAKLPWQLIAEPRERELDDLVKVFDGKMEIRRFFDHLDTAIEKAMREGFERITSTRPASDPTKH